MKVRESMPVVQVIPIKKEERSNIKIEIATGVLLFHCWLILVALYG